MGAANWTAACCSNKALSPTTQENIPSFSAWSQKPFCCSSSSAPLGSPHGSETLIATSGGAYPSIGAETLPPAAARVPFNEVYAKPETATMGGGDMKSMRVELPCNPVVREWDSKVSKGDNESLGMELRIHDNGVSICDILEGGAISVANDVNGSDKEMRVGDLIIAVNGICGEASELIGHMKGSSLRFTMRRHLEIRVNITNGCILGADISEDEDGIFKVTAIGEGCIHDYNSEVAPAGCEVVVGDRLVSVTGSPTSKSLLLDLASQSDGGGTELVFSRAK